MNTIIKLEDAGKLILAYFGSLQFGYEWWVFFAWLLVPDLSMIGYMINSRFGAYLYNLFHHQGFSILVFITGIIFRQQELILAGMVLFGHSAMDRMFGYGLKYTDSFKHTHLGIIGKENSKMPKVH